MDTSGFYKLNEDKEFMYAPNFVALPSGITLEKEKADKFNYPLDGWYYFISEEAAIAFKNL